MPSAVSSLSWLGTPRSRAGEVLKPSALQLSRPGGFRQTNATEYGSQECPLPAQDLTSSWLLGPLLVPLTAQWVTRHSISAPTPEGSWYAPQPCWAKLASNQVDTGQGAARRGDQWGLSRTVP